MTRILDIHDVALSRITEKHQLDPVSLKHAFPERPLRTLGLMKIDGDVFSSDKLSMAVFLKIDFPVYFTVRSMFLRPRLELNLPVFACEVMVTGSKKMVIVDIHRTGEDTDHDDSVLFDRMIRIRDRFPDLNRHAITQKGKIQSVFSRAACQVRITEELDGQAIALFEEYLDVFLEILQEAVPLTGDVLARASDAYEKYLEKVIDHDPGVKGFKMIFGAKGGVERCLNIHFDR